MFQIWDTTILPDDPPRCPLDKCGAARLDKTGRWTPICPGPISTRGGHCVVGPPLARGLGGPAIPGSTIPRPDLLYGSNGPLCLTARRISAFAPEGVWIRTVLPGLSPTGMTTDQGGYVSSAMGTTVRRNPVGQRPPERGLRNFLGHAPGRRRDTVRTQGPGAWRSGSAVATAGTERDRPCRRAGRPHRDKARRPPPAKLGARAEELRDRILRGHRRNMSEGRPQAAFIAARPAGRIGQCSDDRRGQGLRKR